MAKNVLYLASKIKLDLYSIILHKGNFYLGNFYLFTTYTRNFLALTLFFFQLRIWVKITANLEMNSFSKKKKKKSFVSACIQQNCSGFKPKTVVYPLHTCLICHIHKCLYFALIVQNIFTSYIYSQLFIQILQIYGLLHAERSKHGGKCILWQQFCLV